MDMVESRELVKTQRSCANESWQWQCALYPRPGSDRNASTATNNRVLVESDVPLRL